MNRLITIKFSHYNEKARWALEHAGIDYREEGHLPFFHFPAVMRANPSGGASDRVSTRYSTPALQTSDGTWICDSTDIVRWAAAQRPERSLLPAPHADDALALDAEYSRTLGAATRCIAYHTLLDAPALTRDTARRNVPGWESHAWSATYPLLVRALRSSLRVNARTAAKNTDRVRAIFDGVGERLADGRPYLTGDTFTLADVSFAALSVPALLVTEEEGFGAYLPSPEEAPEPLRSVATELRNTPAGAHALRMFATMR